MRKAFIICLFTLFAMPCFSQVSVVFVPEVYGRNLNGLFNCNIINNTRKLTASLKITLSERKAGTICNIKTSDFDIYPGNNLIPARAAQAAGIQFANNKLAQITSQSRSFPEGDYDYCFELTFKNSDNPPLEQCFPYTLEPFTDLSLIEPYNQDKICDRHPLLTWQPLLPGITGSYYQLALTEVQADQNPTEALNYNLPIVNQNNITAPMLPYPSIAKDLEKGKKYAWQVTAYKDQTVLSRSDVWVFTIDCQDSAKVTTDLGYRDIENLAKGNFYIAEGTMKFAVVNAYGPQNLDYEIFPADRQNQPVKHLPKIKLETGNNKVDIDLSGYSQFKSGYYYIINVRLGDGSVKSLRFLYKEPQ